MRWSWQSDATRTRRRAGIVAAVVLAEALRRLTRAHERAERESVARRGAEQRGDELARLAEERRLLALEAVAAEERARQRIAEDLHDGALQTLLAAKQDLIEAGRGRAGVTRASVGVSEGIDGLRRAVGSLHPVTIDHDGLLGAVRAAAAEAERRGGFRCDLRIGEGVSGPHDHLLLSLTRELLANAAKHSGAGHVSVSISRDRGGLLLQVNDDGCGFDAAESLATPCDGHIGLACAERRARALGGDLQISADPESGTAISVALPVVAA